MRVRFLTNRVTAMLGAASLTMLFVTTPGLRAEEQSAGESKRLERPAHGEDRRRLESLFECRGAHLLRRAERLRTSARYHQPLHRHADP